MNRMAATLEELTAIEEIGPGTYRSKALPEPVGYKAGVAFGGCALGVATRAAHATVPASHALYSLVGHFLGPARTDAPLECAVHATRDTRAFATRRIEVRQRQPDGRTRLCLEAFADFHAREGAGGGLAWSATPARPYAAVAHQPAAGAFSVLGGVAAERTAVATGLFALGDRHFETRYCREGVGAQNLHGFLKGQPTTQDALPAPARSTAEYLRARSPVLSTEADQAASLAFLLDGGVAGCALTHADGGLAVDDVTALASLDFALRVTTPDVDLRRWHLRERTVPAAGHGRTYAEARLWSEDGTLVAVMSQQGILRLKGPPPKL